MIALRIWIVVLAAMAFLGGLAAGRWMTLSDVQAAARARGAFEDYAMLLEQRFELGPERSKYLRVILESYERDLARVKQRRLEDYWSGVEPELQDLTRHYEGYIRDRVLPPQRRAEYDAAGTVARIPVSSPSDSPSSNFR